MNYKISGFADEIDGSLVKQIEALKGLSMSYVEMRGVDGNNLIFHDDAKVKDIKKALDENNIHLSALGSPLGKIGIGDSFEPHFEEFKRAVEVAHMMDCSNIRMFSFYLPEGGKPEEYKEAVFERIGSFVDYAKTNGVLLLHENEKGIYGEMAAECRELMENFYGDNFKAIFDFANFVQCGQDTLQAYDILKDYIAYIHVKDAKAVDGKVVPVGYGDGNVKSILKELYKNGFEGFLSLEPHLFNFSGFAELEKDGKSMEGADRKILSGEEAFNLAHAALIDMLNKLEA